MMESSGLKQAFSEEKVWEKPF